LTAQTLQPNSTKIPGELGKYISLADKPITYIISDVDGEGNVLVTMTMTFNVIKHSNIIGYFELKGSVLSFTNSTIFKFDSDYTDIPHQKVNHNPKTGEKIAKAICSRASSVTVTFDKVVPYVDAERLRTEGRIVNFNMSRIK